jgi:hypothetical protein
LTELKALLHKRQQLLEQLSNAADEIKRIYDRLLTVRAGNRGGEKCARKEKRGRGIWIAIALMALIPMMMGLRMSRKGRRTTTVEERKASEKRCAEAKALRRKALLKNMMQRERRKWAKARNQIAVPYLAGQSPGRAGGVAALINKQRS